MAGWPMFWMRAATEREPVSTTRTKVSIASGPIQLVKTTRRLRHLQIPSTPATATYGDRGGIGVFG